LAVPVLMVASGFQKPSSTSGVNVTIEYREAEPNPCARTTRCSLIDSGC
jgi:hypothetical protein